MVEQPATAERERIADLQDGRARRIAQLHRGARERPAPVRACRRGHALAHAQRLGRLLRGDRPVPDPLEHRRARRRHRPHPDDPELPRERPRRRRAPQPERGARAVVHRRDRAGGGLVCPGRAARERVHEPPPCRRRRRRHLHQGAGGVPAALVGLHRGGRRHPRLRDDGAERAGRPDRQGGGADRSRSPWPCWPAAAASRSRSPGASRSGSRSPSTLVWLGRLVRRVERREQATKPATPLRQPGPRVLGVHGAAGADGRLPGHDAVDRDADRRVADGHGARIDLHGVDPLPGRGQRRQHGHHPGDRPEAVGAADGGRPGAGDGRLSGRDGLARD